MFRTLTAKVGIGALALLGLVAIAAIIVATTISTTRSSAHHLTLEIHRVDYSHEFVIFLNKAIAEAQMYALQQAEEDRDEAVAAIAAADDSLTSIKEILDDEDVPSQEIEESQELFQQRVVLFQDIRNDVNALIAGVSANDANVVAGRLESLEDAEQLVAQMEESSDQIVNTDVEEDATIIDALFQTSLYAVISVSTLLALTTLGGIWLLRRNIVQPVQRLARSAHAVADGDFTQVVAVTNNDEIGDLQRAFNRMIGDLQEQRTALEVRNAEVEHSMSAQQRLFETVQQLSTPLLPIAQGVVALPIVGHIDTQRANAITETLVRGVAAHRARVAILDVTGIAVLDTHVTKLLFQAIQAVELLGARVLVAGITATMAQVIVEQGIDFGQLKTYRDLGAALEAVLQRDLLQSQQHTQVTQIA